VWGPSSRRCRHPKLRDRQLIPITWSVGQARDGSKAGGEKRACSRAKAPVPRTNGDRALISVVLREPIHRGMATNWGFLAPCCRNAHTPSCLPIISLGLPGPLPVDPLTIRSQDGHPSLLPISASSRNPSVPVPPEPFGSRVISMRRSGPHEKGRTTCFRLALSPPVLTGEDSPVERR